MRGIRTYTLKMWLYTLRLWRLGIGIAIWIVQAWTEAWKFLRTATSKLLNVVVRSGILVLAIGVFLVLIYQNRAQIFGWERLFLCSNSAGTRVVIGYPYYIASGEVAELYVLVQNTSHQTPTEDLRVGILSGQGWDLWFPDGNSLEIKRLGALGTYQGAIRVLLPYFVSSRGDITLNVFVQRGDSPPEVCSQSISLKSGKLRGWFAGNRSLTHYTDVVLKLLGILTAFVAAILTLSGKVTQMIDKILEWTKAR